MRLDRVEAADDRILVDEPSIAAIGEWSMLHVHELTPNHDLERAVADTERS